MRGCVYTRRLICAVCVSGCARACADAGCFFLLLLPHPLPMKHKVKLYPNHPHRHHCNFHRAAGLQRWFLFVLFCFVQIMGGIIIFMMRHEIYAGRKMRKKGSVRLQRDISSRRPEHNRQSSLGAAAITHSDSGRGVGTVCKGWRVGCCFQTK